MTPKNPKLIDRNGSVLKVLIGKTVPIKDTDDVDQLKKEGYHILEIVNEDGAIIMHRRSKATDGYVRTPDTVWHKEAEIFPYESDQLWWSLMVTWWFNGARADASYMNMLETTYKDVDVKAMLDAAELKMKNTRSKQGRKGQRRGDLHQWLVNDRNSFATRYTWNRKTN